MILAEMKNAPRTALQLYSTGGKRFLLDREAAA